MNSLLVALTVLLSVYFGFQTWEENKKEKDLKKFLRLKESRSSLKKIYGLWVFVGSLFGVLLMPTSAALGAVAGGAAGAGLASYRERAKRKNNIAKMTVDVPEFLDLFSLLLIAESSGASAFSKASDILRNGPLKYCLQKAKNAIAYGQSQEQAFVDLALSMHDEETRQTFQNIAVFLKMGSSVAPFVRAQARRYRTKELLALERKAQTAGLKLLFPIFVFIWPAFFLILFGSIYLTTVQQGLFR